MKTRPNGDAIIRHREFVADITAGLGNPTAFDVTPYAINPGQALTFPWLSKVAANYESYQFDSLKFCYETEAPTSLGGTMVMTVDYDASDDAPVSKQQAMTYRSAVRSAPWNPSEHVSLMEDLRKSKTNFVRPGAQPPNTDIKTYDVGNLFLISQGITTPSAAMGELYVEYTVRLMTPAYNIVPPLVVGGIVISGGTVTAVNPMGSLPTVDAQSYGFTIDNKSTIHLNVPGTHLLTVNISGTDITNFTALALGVAPVFVTILADGSGGTWVFSVANGEPLDIPLAATCTTVGNCTLIVTSSGNGSLG